MVSPGELKVGMNVTVMSWKQREGLDFDGFGVKTITYTDRSYVGDVLRVEAIDLPFIVVTTSSHSILLRGVPIKLDTREVLLKELADAYVEAMQRKPK